MNFVRSIAGHSDSCEMGMFSGGDGGDDGNDDENDK